MKYALIIPDGAADEPQASLGGLTPFQAARTPNMDAVATAGVVGRANHVPDSMPSGRDVGTMSLFGYDPLEFLRDARDRIVHVHLKDVHLDKAAPVFAGEQSIMQGWAPTDTLKTSNQHG